MKPASSERQPSPSWQVNAQQACPEAPQAEHIPFVQAAPLAVQKGRAPKPASGTTPQQA